MIMMCPTTTPLSVATSDSPGRNPVDARSFATTSASSSRPNASVTNASITGISSARSGRIRSSVVDLVHLFPVVLPVAVFAVRHPLDRLKQAFLSGGIGFRFGDPLDIFAPTTRREAFKCQPGRFVLFERGDQVIRNFGLWLRLNGERCGNLTPRSFNSMASRIQPTILSSGGRSSTDVILPNVPIAVLNFSL